MTCAGWSLEGWNKYKQAVETFDHRRYLWRFGQNKGDIKENIIAQIQEVQNTEYKKKSARVDT